MYKTILQFLIQIIAVIFLVSCSGASENSMQDDTIDLTGDNGNNPNQDIDISGGLYPNLPDLLTTKSGLKIEDIATWESVRRPEILNIFRDSVYGRMPKIGEYTSATSVVENTPLTNGNGVRKVVEFAITGPNGTYSFRLPVYLPNNNQKAPIFILINHRSKIFGLDPNSGYFPLDFIFSKGYGAAVINVDDFTEDNNVRYRTGLIEQFNMTGTYDWKCLSSWAFVTSRMVDYLETDANVDASKISVIGHSRSGKAAMWAGAHDERIALTCPNNAGIGGDKLVRYTNQWAQDLYNTYRIFPHWYANKFGDYANMDKTLPFDFHQLASLIAPRLIANGSASQDGNAGPEGQFHTVALAQPVFALYEKAEIIWTVKDAPRRNSTIDVIMENGNIHHHMRVGEHDLKTQDWKYYINFADEHWKN